IEMGRAEDWQTWLATRLDDLGVIILNPRRDDWDSSWEQSINNPQFREQVEWELKYLEACSYILLYLSPRTMSPISLLELGLNAHRSKHLVVCCPEGFWRRGNVEIVCVRYGIPLLTSLDAAIATLREIAVIEEETAST